MKVQKKRLPETGVVLETSLGRIELALDVTRAPVSAGAFLRFIDDGSFAQGGAFYRTVRSGENDNGSPKIDVIEAGVLGVSDPIPGIAHESTAQSGLRHLHGTISLPRYAVGTATGQEFFICIGDQPALDAGGARSKDGHGYAAIGRVTAGMDVVNLIHGRRTSNVADDPYLLGQILESPVRILAAFRKEE